MGQLQRSRLDIQIDGKHYISRRSPRIGNGGLRSSWRRPSFPDYPTRRKIDTRVTKFVREHIVIYHDPAKQSQIWQWVKREAGKLGLPRAAISKRTNLATP